MFYRKNSTLPFFESRIDTELKETLRILRP